MEKENNTLPKDWRIKRLGEVSTINNKTLTEKTDKNYSFFYLDLSSVKEGIIDFPKEKIVFKSAPSRARRILLKNNIVIATVRPNLKGFALIEFEPVDFICSTGFALISAPNLDDAKFIYQNFYGKYIEKQIENLVVGSSYPAINNSDVENLLIKYPTNQLERSKIAEILSTWDEAIQTTQSLIKKLEIRKKGMMQRLFSGESKDWKEVKFKDCFERITSKNDEGNTNVLTISAQNGLISQRDFFNKSVASEDVKGYYLLKKGDFAYNKSYSAGYPWGANKRLDLYNSGILSPLYVCFSLKNGNSDFFVHFFEGGCLDKGIYTIAQEGARNHGLLNMSVIDFFELKITIPPIEEQTAIAKILNTADAELNETKAYLETLKQQKKGLMQQLLTGRIRVK